MLLQELGKVEEEKRKVEEESDKTSSRFKYSRRRNGRGNIFKV